MQNPPIGYSGQYLDNHAFRIKIRTGSDIHNATGDSVLGELFLETGMNASETQITGKLYCATATTDTDVAGEKQHIFHVSDLTNRWVNFPNKYSIQLDGSSDYMDTNATWWPSPLQSSFSLSMWVKFDSTAGADHQAVFGQNAITHFDLYFQLSTNKVTVRYKSESAGSSHNLSYTKSAGWNSSDWVHLAFTAEQVGATMVEKLFVDGVLEATQSVTNDMSVYSSSDNLYVGGRNSSGTLNLPFEGKIDEVALFPSALSEAAIAAIYGGGTPTSLSSYSPVAWWRMGDDNLGAGSTVTNKANPGTNDGTLIGSTFSTDAP